MYELQIKIKYLSFNTNEMYVETIDRGWFAADSKYLKNVSMFAMITMRKDDKKK